MPVLIASKTALPSRTTNTPSTSLRSWPGLSSAACTPPGRRRGAPGVDRLRGRWRPCRRAPSRARSSPESAPPGRCPAIAVVISAVQVKPGRTFGNLAFDLQRHLEVGRLRGGRLSRGLNRAVADFGDPGGERLAGHRVDRDLGHLTDLHVGNVGLVDFDFRFDHRHVGHLEQHGSGVVHGADHRRFTLLDVAAGDDAVDRRFDPDLAQVGPGVLERGRFLVACAAAACGRSAPGRADPARGRGARSPRARTARAWSGRPSRAPAAACSCPAPA